MATTNGAATLNSVRGAGAMLQLIRNREATTRAELVEVTGLGRSTVAHRLEALAAHGFIRSGADGPSTGGRPPTVLEFKRDAGVVLAADLGALHARVAVTDLGAGVLVERREEIDIADGPDAVLDWLERTFEALLAEAGRPEADVRGIGVGVPGPVEFASGRPVAPPIMPGWDGYPVAARLRGRFGAVSLVDNDVNVTARGEHAIAWPNTDHLLYVKVATGIGSGIVAGGRIHRGEHGAAGDMGHIHVAGRDDVICACGNTGCLEAVAGGRALAMALNAMGIEAHASADVVRHARAGRPEAVQLVRQAGRTLGEVLAAAVNLLNPTVIVIGGDVADAHEQLLAGVREIVYQRSLPLATRSLEIVRSRLQDRAGVIGAATTVLDQVLSPEAVDEALAVGA
jgi:predicted NBD/HSP70 family sugar kinase